MKIFFDTEFTGLHKDTTLISIGLIASDGTTFYGELTDYNKNQVNDWIQEHVINNLLFNDKEEEFTRIEPLLLGNKSVEVKGNKEYVSSILNSWLGQFHKIEWISDVCHYDFVLLIDLICGHALKLPYGKWNSACHDINQDIAKTYNIDEIKAFDKSREEILKEHDIYVYGKKHNSLYDAKVIKVIYDIVK